MYSIPVNLVCPSSLSSLSQETTIFCRKTRFDLATTQDNTYRQSGYASPCRLPARTASTTAPLCHQKQFQHRFTLLHNQASAPPSVPIPSLYHQDAIVQHVLDNNITQPDLRQNYHVRFLLNFIRVAELSHLGGILEFDAHAAAKTIN